LGRRSKNCAPTDASGEVKSGRQAKEEIKQAEAAHLKSPKSKPQGNNQTVVNLLTF
jgi:hypothetical protein